MVWESGRGTKGMVNENGLRDREARLGQRLLFWTLLDSLMVGWLAFQGWGWARGEMEARQAGRLERRPLFTRSA